MAGAGGSGVLDVAFLPGPGPSGVDALLDGIREQGVTVGDVTVLHGTGDDVADELAGALAARDDRPMALLEADLVVSSVPLGAVLDDPRWTTAALAEPVAAGDRASGPSSEVEFLGVLKVGPQARAAAAGLARTARPDPDEPLLGLVAALQAGGTPVKPVPLTGYVWARPHDETEASSARAGVAALPERRVRLREAARGGDGFYSTFVLRRLSWRFTDLALRLRLTPNQVTVVSLALGLAAAGLLATGQRGWMVLAAVLLQLCLVVDCVDGELARFRRRFSRFGAWLDATTDRVKEFAAIGGLAFAAERAGTPVWWLAATAIGLQTFRHVFELGWALQREYAAGGVTPAPPQWQGSGARLRFKQIARPQQDFDWLRRLGHFPIGERFLVMSLGAALLTPRITLWVLTAGSALAAAYMLAAFVVRARSARAPAPRLRAMLDAGPLLRLVRLPASVARRVEALLPGVVAAVELALLWYLVHEVGDASGAAATALVGAAAIAHYQHDYGVRELAVGTGRPPRPTLGTDGRLILTAAIVVGGVAGPGAWVLAAVVLADTVLGSLYDWLGGPRPAPQRAGTPVEAGGTR